MGNFARNFPGGAATDNLLSGSNIQGTQQVSIYFRFNATAYDATTRRPFEWGVSAAVTLSIIVSNSGVFNIIGGQYATTAGNWNFTSPSTGAEHDLLVTLDSGSVSNVPVAFLDAVSQSVGTVGAPVGAFTSRNDSITLGNRADLTRCFNGWVSTAAIWTNILLAQGDATNLHNGVAPCAISPSNLVFYAPLDRGDSPEPELIVKNNLTVTGSTVVAGSTVVTNPRCRNRYMMLG